ncbi:MAG TPA: DUF465 domain-containing protein [Terriglobia bacterium]|nr:DUF465 domain-containing protein [Terriglobia bacterium]
MNDEQIREHLMSSNPEFYRLVEEHQNFEQRLHDLQTHHHMTEQDLLEEAVLKKKKLQTKDKINLMMNQLRTELSHQAI